MINANGPGFKGLYAGDVVEFRRSCPGCFNGNSDTHTHTNTAAVLPLLVFADHVQVRFGACGFTVDDRNFIRLVRRGKLHMQATGKNCSDET